MENSNVVPFRGDNIMTPEQYDAERAKIDEVYGGSGAEAAAMRDRALATLYAKSGWTQERLAEREGKQQPWVAKRLCFGRFLNSIPSGNTVQATLTERRFRGFWERTEGEVEGERFREVTRLMDEEPVPSEPIFPFMCREYGDGKEYKLQEVADRLGVPVDYVEAKAKVNNSRRASGKLVFKKRGSKRRGDYHTTFHLYAKKKTLKAIEPVELRTKLVPLIKALIEEGRKSEASISPAIVLGRANELMHIVEDWTEE